MHHALVSNITKITIAKNACGLEKLHRADVFRILRDTITNSGVAIQLISKTEPDTMRKQSSRKRGHYAQNEDDNYTNELILVRDDLGNDFNRDTESCNLACSKQSIVLKPKQKNDDLTD